jgi:hypothetical protein
MGIVRFKSLSVSVMSVSPVMFLLPSAPVLLGLLVVLGLLVDQGDRDVVDHHIFAFGLLSTAQDEWLWHWGLWFRESGGINLNWPALRSGDLERLWCFRTRRVARSLDGDRSGDWLSHDIWLAGHGYCWLGHDIWTASHLEVWEERLEGVAESGGIDLRNASRFWLLAALVMPVPSVLAVMVAMLSSFAVLSLLFVIQECAVLLRHGLLFTLLSNFIELFR